VGVHKGPANLQEQSEKNRVKLSRGLGMVPISSNVFSEVESQVVYTTRENDKAVFSRYIVFYRQVF